MLEVVQNHVGKDDIINQWFEIMENCKIVGYVSSKSGKEALLEWVSTHGPGEYRIFEMWYNGQPVIKRGCDPEKGEYIQNSIGERAYKCVHCGTWISEGYSRSKNEYVCEYCADEEPV